MKYSINMLLAIALAFGIASAVVHELHEDTSVDIGVTFAGLIGVFADGIIIGWLASRWNRKRTSSN